MWVHTSQGHVKARGEAYGQAAPPFIAQTPAAEQGVGTGAGQGGQEAAEAAMCW